MKYGVLYNKYNINIGDDIQAYATARFLPQVDYFIDREYIDDFKTENGEPVAVIMNAWYMWAKWNWPPSKYILPHMIGFHYADHQLAHQPGSPIKFEFLEGIGGDYLRAYGPIGCRDKFTMGKLNELGIDAYFSGCITMTLPKMPEREDKGSYICLVDLDKRVERKIIKMLENEDIEVKVITQNRARDGDMSWEDRCKMVEELLTLYQNARCIVTKRLHCSLPCLAMDVPVYLVKEMENDIRFDPYYDFFYRTTVTKFLNDEFDYDFLNPPKNKGMHIPYREKIIESCENFIKSVENETRTVDELCKTTYTPDEILRWRHDTMKQAMNLWLVEGRVIQKDKKALEKQGVIKNKKIAKLEKELESAKKKAAKFKGELVTAKKERDSLAKYQKQFEQLDQEKANFRAMSKKQKIQAIKKGQI